MSEQPTAQKPERGEKADTSAGVIFVITAPSGSGKTSLCWAVIDRVEGLEFSVSHTTRPPRGREKEGRDYYFVDNETFDRMIENDEFIEWASLYDRRYGTSIKEIERASRGGIDLLIEIDRQGARQIREKLPDAVGIFIMPPSIDTLRQRLTARGTETSEEIEKRLSIAGDEMQDYVKFEYAVVNDSFDNAVKMLESIISAERCKVSRQKKKLENIVKGYSSQTEPAAE